MAYEDKDDSGEDNRFKDWQEELWKFQESDLDQREQSRECDRFLLDKDGQWEEGIANQLDSDGRPRYTFDKVTPAIESMMVDIEDMDFGGNVKPNGGDANKDTALTLDGMVRAIQNMSRTDDMYRAACRRNMRRGMDAWIVKAKYKDAWSFEQDLFVEAIPNAVNRVWCSNTSTKADSSDSEVAYVLSSMSPAAYKKRWPEGSKVSVSDSDIGEAFDNYRPEVITIAERYYRKECKATVAQLDNGDVVRIPKDEGKQKEQELRLAMDQIKVVQTKEIDDYVWYHCVFDGGGILEDERETVFKSNPVVTIYGNYELLGQNSKITYSGTVLKQMDAQRVHNYGKSREIEEGALAPREKWWMTKTQAKGHEKQISRMNVSSDPVQFFNPDAEYPGAPARSGGSMPNPHLSKLAQDTSNDIATQMNVSPAMRGEFAGRMSEDAIKQQVDRGTGGTRKWVNALVLGIQRTCDLLVETIPIVYDTKRQFDIIALDGTESTVTLNDEIYDQDKGLTKLNNLNAGKYKVVCEAGPAFANKLEAGLDAMIRYAEIDPSIIATGGDIMMKAIDAPLVDIIANRKRQAMLQAGQIPPDEMSDEEKEQVEQMAQQPSEPDAMMIAAQAEDKKAQADIMKAENDRAKLQLEGAKVQLGGRKLEVETAKTVGDLQNKQADTGYKVAQTRNTDADTALKLSQLEGEALQNEIANTSTDELVRLMGG